LYPKELTAMVTAQITLVAALLMWAGYAMWHILCVQSFGGM
jgi:hypothetical protein